tara:strand:- start:708 stop:1988 length:1281 start_codon:yes stop_codon:yes gene_type:complete
MITVYSSFKSSRLEYILNFIFKNILEIEFKWTQDYTNLDGVILNYSDDILLCQNYQIQPSGFLVDGNWDFKKYIFLENKSNYFFPQEKGDHDFDVLSSIFFLITRMEEYHSKDYDEHQRFISFNSSLVKLSLEQNPIVDQWCLSLLNQLNTKFNVELTSPRKFHQYCTFDIDNAYAFKYKSSWRSFGSFFKDLLSFRFYKLKQRVEFLVGKIKDPYDNYDYILGFLKINQLKSIFFFLLGDYAKMDKNINHNHPSLINLIRFISKNNLTGIHPSYKSFNNLDTLKMEISRLDKITSKTSVSRFHYLKFTLPESYQILLKAGIKQDYSMGFVDRIGFRAGTCTPFNFYDLEKECTTDLKIFPFAYMDGVLNDKLKYTPEHSSKLISEIKLEVRKVNGSFNAIWHNESLSNQDRWKGWRTVFETTWLD